jgi:hypothetical protein
MNRVYLQVSTEGGTLLASLFYQQAVCSTWGNQKCRGVKRLVQSHVPGPMPNQVLKSFGLGLCCSP